ncbi:MAG: Glycogen synthase [Chlamydiales bacterium]|nr:Glycogen synthase [Chlamydiales bacterium]
MHIAAELAPIAKVGGLADVLHGLSRATLQKNHTLQIILPKYDTLPEQQIEHLEILNPSLSTRFDGKIYTSTLWQGFVDQIPVLFIEPITPHNFFNRGTIYGCEDDIARFSFFCLAAISYLRTLNPKVIHLHDWHTALMAGLIKENYPEITSKILFTIHNLAYQGHCTAHDLDKVGWKSEKIKDHTGYNLLKGGITFADHITTVSPSYAQEILTTEEGRGLQSTLKKYQHKLSGILNGIDYGYWDPTSDPLLPFHYTEQNLAHKALVKEALRKKLSLSETSAPLVCAITRLVPQKGPDLIKAALLHTLQKGGQFVLLGSAPDEATQKEFKTLQKELLTSTEAHLELSFNEELSHLLYAASDLFLVPSIFEPCGLTQMIAMHYGSVPLVRETGGLADTVFEGKNGFSFKEPHPKAIKEALDRAFEVWGKSPQKWQRLIKAGMREDYSWNKPAGKYLKLSNLS